MSIYRMSINTNTKPKRKKTRGGNLVLFYTIASLDPFPVMQGFGGFSAHCISFPHFRYFFFSMALFSFKQNKKRKRTATDIIMAVVERLCMQVNGFSFSRPWWTIRRGLVEW